MPLFDTHAHLDDEQFDAVRDEVVSRFLAAGIETAIAVGTTASASAKCVEIAEQYASIYAAVGIQPNYCAEVVEGDWDKIVALSQHPRAVALGETGLDRYWDHCPFEIQQDYFDRHLRLSAESELPFIVHMRECDDDILQMLRAAYKQGPLRGVMHSFTGGAEMAAECVAMGMYISFAGMVTFKKSNELREVAATVPDGRLLIETDCPYLSPHPLRSKRPNEPSYIVHTAACLAEVRGVTPEELGEQTTANARRFFNLPG
jgi:TatD DNase family protein